MVDALAFVIWNLAPRSPLRIARDIAAAARRPGVLLRGTVSFAVGLLLLAGGVGLLVPLLLPQHALVAVATWSAVTGLLVELLVGPLIYGRPPEP